MVAALPLRIVDEVGSTSAVLVQFAAGGAAAQALMARRQVDGRGRRGRSWVGVDGNLFLSVLLRPMHAVRPGHWSLLSAVALAEVVSAALTREGAGPRLKWPNDVMLPSGKLAGILLDAGDDGGPWVVIGIGVNLVGRPVSGAGRIAVLAEEGTAPNPEVFSESLIDKLLDWQRRYERDGFAPVREAWLRLGHRPGDALTVDGGRLQGVFAGLDEDGALLLREADGQVRRVTAGEVGAG